MFKNKKLLLSSVAIVLALVVSSIFVNFTLANSDSQASLSDNETSSSSSSITGLSNIDLAIDNSNDASKQATGDDKYRIVQIVPNSYQANADADESLKEKVTAGSSSKEVQALDGYDTTTYLWKYVYAGEYFRLAVFDGYKTIEDDMAEGAVTLTTCTVSQLNDMDTDAQEILNKADFIYVWANSYSDYASTANDISEELYNWLDSYATTDSHAFAICTGALCINDPDSISGNNDDYRMGSLAYKVMTKGTVARFDNVLVTDSEFFKTLYEEADDSKVDPNTGTTATISDFILYAERNATDGGGYYIGGRRNEKTIDGKKVYVGATYYKWYDDKETLSTFTSGGSNYSDSAYVKAGSTGGNITDEIKNGATFKKTAWDYDNAKVLVISEDTESDDRMAKTFSGMNTSGSWNDSSKYEYNKKTKTWESVNSAANSELTSNLYTKDGKTVPSGADIYEISSSKLQAAIEDGTEPFDSVFMSSSYYMDVPTTTVSGTVSATSGVELDTMGLHAYLYVQNGDTIQPVVDSSGSEYVTSLTKEENARLDEDGNVVEENGEPIYDTVYTYEFSQLNSDYDYVVVIAPPEGDGYTVGRSKDKYEVVNDDGTTVVKSRFGKIDDTNDYQYDFIVTDDKDNPDNADALAGYLFRDTSSNDTKYVVTLDDYVDAATVTAAAAGDNDENAGLPGVSYKGYDEDGFLIVGDDDEVVSSDYVDFSEESNVTSYVDSLHATYQSNELTRAEESGASKLDLTEFDFIFIDSGKYSEEIGTTTLNALKDACEKGVYFIVSSSAGDGKGSGSGDSGKGGKTTIVSPSAKAVADVINASVYRDGADNKFKVLEIQPDFPIDLDVAASESTWTTAYTTRSDGTTKITGNYYTVPSDVVSGKSKEELEEQTEYYQFDLTKAKIAHAIDGVDYSNIELTQVSTEKLIGMKDDIAATYDLVYIGGDISAMDRNPAEMYKGQNDLGNASSGYTYQIVTTFIMYYHTGTLSQLQSAGTYTPDTGVSGTHMMAEPYVGSTYYKTTYLAENGNDLTKTKYDELMNYISSGKPVIVSDELTSVYENMQGTNASGEKLSDAELLQGFWYKDGELEKSNCYLDPSSRMYDLVGNIYTRKNGSKGGNVLWGFDSNDTQNISDPDLDYGTGMYTLHYENGKWVQYYEYELADSANNKLASKQNWYYVNDSEGNQTYDSNNENIKYFYKEVFSDDLGDSLNNLVKNSSQRTRVTMVSKPTTYQQGIESSYVKTNRLSYTFRVQSGEAETYDYVLYVDKDKNTTYDDTDYMVEGSVTTALDGNTNTYSIEKTVNMTLDTEFYGSASWYLKITDSSGNTVATTTGLSKIVNNNTTSGEINVLQVQTMAEGQSAKSWQATDTLYFDIESQTAHKIAKYNVFANQTELDQSDTTQYAALGLHENRFGIYEYDTATDADDYYSNLADELSEDYDINLDIVVASDDKASFTTGDGVQSSYDCLDTMVAEAEKLDAGEKVDGYTQEEYEELASQALSEYTTAEAEVAEPKDALDTFLANAVKYMNGESYTGSASDYKKFIDNFRTSTSETQQVIEYMMETGDYYIIFWPKYNIMNHCENAFKSGQMSDDFGTKYATLYSAYIKKNDAKIVAKQKYNTYLRRSYGKDFMKNMYSILVLGPSDSFGGFKVDFEEITCQYILDYVASGGDMFFYHDSMTPYADAGAVNLTRSLLSVVGMNRFHVDITNNVVTYDEDSSIELGSYSVTTDDYSSFSYSSEGGRAHESTTVKNLKIYHYYWTEGAPQNGVFYVTEKAGYKVGDSKYGDAYILAENFKTSSGTVSEGLIPLSEAASSFGMSEYVDGVLPTDTVVYYKSDNDDKYAKVDYTTNGNYTDITYNSPDASLYYLTNYANNTSGGKGIINSINANIMNMVKLGTKLGNNVSLGTWSLKSKDTKVYVSALAMTALYYNGNMAGATTTLPYVYAAESYKAATAWSQAANQDQSACAETVKAEQLNSGLVTLYPYNISSTLNISGTHQQAYALDLESDNITVWYTLAGSNNSSDAKNRSSKYAADPGDGMEGYFIYTTSYGSGAITYCGAGHSSVTGRNTRNNDERKLFINVIINSSSAVPEMPTIKVYKPTNTFVTEDELDKDEEAVAESGKTIYLREVDSKTDSPTFDYQVMKSENTKITKVNVYYDLDYDDSDYTNRPYFKTGTDVMIDSYTTVGDKKLSELGGVKRNVRDGSLENLKPQDEYFAAYGGGYTYIVIEVYYQGKSIPVYTMIKVKASDPLFDLTQNTSPTISVSDYIVEKRYTGV